MAMLGTNISSFLCHFVSAFAILILLAPNSSLAKKTKLQGMKMNVIDRCWRSEKNWCANRQKLATCSVGFAGKLIGNTGKDVTFYQVTDPSDNAISPKPGTLRYGVTMIKGKKWITFKKSMNIKLENVLVLSSFTAIDGRGANVHIAGGGCLLAYKVTNVIIHDVLVHNCMPQAPTMVMGPGGKLIHLGHTDADAIRLVSASNVWIDHNTLYDCQDGLLDVTRASTNITISNNWFKNQDKVMLLGHDDGYRRDKNMKVTVLYNHFGPNCNQRMPRIRHGYAHVVNNLYHGWMQYAIGGSMNPSIKSQSNLYIASSLGKKEVTWRKKRTIRHGDSWNFYSKGDRFENGARFNESRVSGVKPKYNAEQKFEVADARFVRMLTRSAGARSFGRC